MMKPTFTKVRTKTVVLFVLCSLTLLLITTTGGATETVVKVEPPIIFARKGETIKINITILNVTNLYGLEITLYWNASILEMTNVDIRLGREHNPDGVLYEPVEILQNQTFQQQGKYLLAGLSVAPEPPLPPSFNGSGNIVILTFEVTDVGRCELKLETKLVSNIIPPGSTSAALIRHTTVDGYFGPILVTAYPQSVRVGENVNISGFISLAQANIPVTFLYKNIEDAEWQPIKTVNTTEKGSYAYIWNPTEQGTYYIKTTATILGRIEESPIVQIIVRESEQPTWPDLATFILAIIVVAIVVTFLLYRNRTRGKLAKH